jgi:hypothetical protein
MEICAVDEEVKKYLYTPFLLAPPSLNPQPHTLKFKLKFKITRKALAGKSRIALLDLAYACLSTTQRVVC